MEGSDDEFGEFDDELKEMKDENVVEEYVVQESNDDNEGLMEESEEMNDKDAVTQSLPTEWSKL